MTDLLIEKEGGLLILTLNRPDHMNAMSSELVNATTTAITDVIENKSARAILITGTGRGFCA